ncbi:zinc-binding dehydrogenase, partial [Bordetella hinzii]|nr:zinc-binding dehydrogenase [Bordetella hinzii]
PDAEDEILLGPEGERHAPRLRIVDRPSPARDEPETDTACRLGFSFPGQLRNLRWESYTAAEPADDQIEVRIQATGLNFRDVMYSLGLLSDEAIENGFAGPTLGLEFSGIVTRVGLAVADYRPGDTVVGFGPASFGDRVLTRASAISHIPANFSFEAAATIPSTFFTVYYALHHLARLEEGEKILIHGAAGGVGIAAIQYAQWVGADIYATAGSEEKRDFLRMMGVTNVYDSRSLSYADEILADTGGIGMDVVLNSLAGEAINRNLQVLRPFGRFLELGKRDFYENTRIGLRPFRNNISYFGIDADQLMCERPDLTRRLFGEMMQLFAEGALHPLPYTVFDANDVVDAFRYMQQARQIGKIVVTYRNGIHRLHR